MGVSEVRMQKMWAARDRGGSGGHSRTGHLGDMSIRASRRHLTSERGVQSREVGNQMIMERDLEDTTEPLLKKKLTFRIDQTTDQK